MDWWGSAVKALKGKSPHAPPSTIRPELRPAEPKLIEGVPARNAYRQKYGLPPVQQTYLDDDQKVHAQRMMYGNAGPSVATALAEMSDAPEWVKGVQKGYDMMGSLPVAGVGGTASKGLGIPKGKPVRPAPTPRPVGRLEQLRQGPPPPPPLMVPETPAWLSSITPKDLRRAAKSLPQMPRRTYVSPEEQEAKYGPTGNSRRKPEAPRKTPDQFLRSLPKDIREIDWGAEARSLYLDNGDLTPHTKALLEARHPEVLEKIWDMPLEMTTYDSSNRLGLARNQADAREVQAPREPKPPGDYNSSQAVRDWAARESNKSSIKIRAAGPVVGEPSSIPSSVLGDLAKRPHVDFDDPNITRFMTIMYPQFKEGVDYMSLDKQRVIRDYEAWKGENPPFQYPLP